MMKNWSFVIALHRVVAMLICAVIAHVPVAAQRQSTLPTATAMTGSELVPGLQSNGSGGWLNRNFTLNQLRGLQGMPTGFTFDFTTYPVNVYRERTGRYYTDYNFRSLIAFTPTATYWVRTSGSNSNNCTTEATACRSISKAFALGNALGTFGTTPYRVNIEAGDYGRVNGWSDNDGAINGGVNTTRPRQPVIVVGYGGVPNVGTFLESATFAADGTYGAQGVYCTTLSVTGATNSNLATLVTDRVNKDGYGDNSEYTYVASTLIASTTPGSWTQSSNTLCIRRLDNQTPTLANLRIYTGGARNGVLDAYSAYIQGINFEGGSADSAIGTFDAGTVASVNRTLVFEDVTFRYGRNIPGSTALFNGLSVDQMSGLVVCNRCSSSKSQNDGFNFHVTGGGKTLYWITSASTCWDTGRTGASDNCLTPHETTIGFDIGGIYQTGAGGTVRGVTVGSYPPQVALFGTDSSGDRGDTTAPFNGNITSTAFAIGGTGAKMWCQECRARRSINSFVAETGATLSLRNVDDGGGNRTAAGTITTF